MAIDFGLIVLVGMIVMSIKQVIVHKRRPMVLHFEESTNVRD